jgi:hypothetical protein
LNRELFLEQHLPDTLAIGMDIGRDTEIFTPGDAPQFNPFAPLRASTVACFSGKLALNPELRGVHPADTDSNPVTYEGSWSLMMTFP